MRRSLGLYEDLPFFVERYAVSLVGMWWLNVEIQRVTVNALYRRWIPGNQRRNS